MEDSKTAHRLYLIGGIILLAGLGIALLVHLTAGPSQSNWGYDLAGGSYYPINPEDSKLYRHDLELYGGKAGLLADGIRRWFVGLWQGKALAKTVAWISIFISAVLFYGAKLFSARAERTRQKGDERGSAG